MNEEIRLLIIDDEEIWRSAVKDALNGLGYTIAGEAATFEEAITALNSVSYDLVLLDIHLNTRNSGLEVGLMLTQLYKKPFIYITGSIDVLTKELIETTKPSAFLVKPVNKTSLIVAIQNALEHFNSSPAEAVPLITAAHTFFFVKHNGKYKKLDWKDIGYLRSEKNYTLLFCTADNCEYAIRSTLIKTLKHIVPEQLKQAFVQINRSEALQLPIIQEVRDEEVKTLYGNFSITEGYFHGLKSAMQILS